MMPPTPRKKPAANKPEQSASVAFGKALYAARTAAGLTQADVAYASGLSLNRISIIEKGRADLRLSSARALSRAVGVPFRDMVGD